jgi:diguanylate cyclase (GGDEF)-like protein
MVSVLLWQAGPITLLRLQNENRRLRREVHGKERLAQDHVELSRESKERNDFHDKLPGFIARLHGETTLPAACRVLVDETSRMLSASEVSLFLGEGGWLVLTDAKGIAVRELRVRIGDGRIGLVAERDRVLTAEDFRSPDADTRAALARDSARIDTKIAASLSTPAQKIGVLNVGGTVGVSAAMRKEILAVIAPLGATFLENRRITERLEREATTDGLTRLSNVRNFKEKFRQELSRAARFGRPLSIFLFDIDHFKHYNDTNGHPAGDECLRITAEVLRGAIRATDLPARYGGEEFVVLLPETDKPGALAFAEKIRAAIASTSYPNREKQPLGCVSISGGVATFPADGKDMDSLIPAADQALYRCKDAGRNRVAAASGPVTRAKQAATS